MFPIAISAGLSELLVSNAQFLDCGENGRPGSTAKSSISTPSCSFHRPPISLAPHVSDRLLKGGLALFV